MSNTRYADPDSELSQERYMSSPEYVETRGIYLNAVAEKASLMLSGQVRDLLYFLQGMSIQPGGVKKLAADILAEFPERIGTPTMHQLKIRKGAYPEPVCRAIHVELVCYDEYSDVMAELLGNEPEAPRKYTGDRGVEFWIERCRERVAVKLSDFIVQLCINPKVRVWPPASNEVATSIQNVQEEAIGRDCDIETSEFKDPTLSGFDDIMGALYEFQTRYAARQMESAVETTIAKEVFKNLSHCLASGKIVVLEGETRIGKTTAAEAWCAAHRGQARFVSISGITQKTNFFREIARAYGIAAGYGKSSTEIQARVEDVSHKTHLMLVIDEAHFAFSQGRRIYSRPELIDWINTALFNHRVPVALLATPQFSERLHQAEKQTGWFGDQFRARIGRYKRLPVKPTEQDVEAVVCRLLPAATVATVDAVVGYSLQLDRPLPAAVNLIEEARLIALENKRQNPSLKDIEAALKGVVLESDLAKKTVLEPRETRRRPPLARALQTPEKDIATPLPANKRTLARAGVDQFTDSSTNGSQLLEAVVE